MKVNEISSNGYTPLQSAFSGGKPDFVVRMLTSNKKINANYQTKSQYPLLHQACQGGHDSLVAALLTYPGVDINLKDVKSYSPLRWAIQSNKPSCARLLLADSRFREKDLPTSLVQCAQYGQVEIVKWMIASVKKFEIDKETMTALKQPQSQGTGLDVLSLLERFIDDPEEIRKEVRKDLGMAGKHSDLIFLISCLFIFSLSKTFKLSLMPPRMGRKTK